MEVCQLSKNLQLGARFSYFETVNSFDLVEILAETFNIYKPDIHTLKAEAYDDTNTLIEILNKSGDLGKFQE